MSAKDLESLVSWEGEDLFGVDDLVDGVADGFALTAPHLRKLR
jgi:hypothetical protein